MQIEHQIKTYLNLGTLTPTNTQVGSAVAGTEWWGELSSIFDDVISLYYEERNVFLIPKYDYEDPATCRETIRKTFGTWIKLHKRQIDRLYVGFMADFNPLWNVDGVEGFVSKDNHTGTDANRHSGTDSTSTEDNGTLTKSGNEDRVGSKTTFDSNVFRDTDKDITTYNSVRDTRDYDGSSETTYNSTMTETRNLQDDHVDMRIRQGNIGVTQSDKILGDAQRLYMDDIMDLWKYIVRSCVNQVSYAVE